MNDMKKWKKLKEVIYDINKFHKINVCKISKNFDSIFDLSSKDLISSDNLKHLQNNNEFIIKDENYFVLVYPRKNKFKFVFSNGIISEEKILHYKYLTVANLYKIFKEFKLSLKNYFYKINNKLIQKNIKKDLNENYITAYYDDLEGFYFEFENPKNNSEKIVNYIKDYIKILSKKYKNLNTMYSININYNGELN